MTYLVSDSWLVLRQDLETVIAVLACVAWGSIVTIAALRGSRQDGSSPTDEFSLAMGGWIVAVFLITVPTFLIGAVFGLRPGLGVAAITLAASAGCLILVVRRCSPRWTATEAASLLGMMGLFIASAWIRLAFVARAALPLYFDSAEHYRITRALMQLYGHGFSASDAAWPVSTYYHMGSHLILSLVAFISSQKLGGLMLVFGQIVLAALPFCLFVIVRRETGSAAAAFVAVALGSAGWYMPAYAVNWGKYPALFSLPVILFCLTVALLASRADGRRQMTLLILSAIAAGAAFLLQTRSVVLLAIGLASWWLARRWSSRSSAQRWVIIGLVLLVLTVQIVVIAIDPIFSSVLGPYVGPGFSVTAVVALLGIVGYWKHPRFAFTCLCAIMLLFLGLRLPVPAFAPSALLDRPLVEMVLFVPLAVLGAAGVAGVTEHFASIGAPIKAAGVALICAAVAAHAFINYSFYPSDCCVLVHGDDLVALDWIDRYLPADARIAIPYAEVRVEPAPYPPLSPNTDAGVWITPLSGRATVNLPYSTDFSQPATLAELCGAGVNGVYVSATPQGFQIESLDGEPGWYELKLSLPGVRIYWVIGCGT